MSTTIKDIAALANVSRGTVDKVLHNRPGVSDEVRERVLQIIKELNYRPNPIGKALVESRIPTRIGVVLTPAYNQFMQVMIDGINHAARHLKPYGVDVITKMAVTLDPVEELNILQGFAQDGVKNIALFPLDDDSIINYANQLVMNDTTLITFNSNIPKIQSKWFIGQDHVKGGRTSAQLMEKILPEGGNIAVIISSNYITCHQDRLNGFKQLLAESSNTYNILDIQQNQDRSEDAFQITSQYLKKYPDLDAIYITGGGVAGVASALRLFSSGKRVKLICHDLLPITQKLLKEGIIDFVVDQDPFHQGDLIIQTLYKYVTSGKLPAPASCSIPIYVRVSESL